MSKYRELAQAVLQAVGGKENVDTVLHCMTRLRFKLRDESIIDLAKIKEIKGVLGAQFAEQSLHVIVGTTAANVYKELVDLGGFEAHAAVDENLDAKPVAAKKKLTPMGIVSAVFNTFASAMTPLIPVFVLMGMANVVASLIGPSFLGLVTEESHLYTNFYNIYQSILYFLPVLVAISSAKVFKTNTMLAVVLATLMLYPDMIAALATEGGYTIYGIAAPNVDYSGQVVSVLLVVWILSYVEKLVDKIVPSALKVIGVPFLSVAIMLPLQFIVLGPLGTNIGTALGNFLQWLHGVAGPVETTLMGAIGVFTVAFGFGRPIFFICLATLMSVGVEYTYLPMSIVTVNYVVMGIAAVYALKAKTAQERETGISCLVSAFLGGVSEPTIFGIILPNRKTYLPAVVGGGLAGLYIGIMKVGYYVFGPSNFMNVLGFVSADNPSNFVHGCIAAGIAFVSSFAMMLLVYKDDGKAKK